MTLKSARSLQVVVAAVGVFALLAACSPSSDPGGDGPDDTTPVGIYEKFAAMEGEERHNALVEAAQAEGEVTVYTTSSFIETTLGPAFEEMYGIRVTVYRAVTNELRTRLFQEAEANSIQNDVVETQESDLALFAEQGDLIWVYKSDIADQIADEFKTPYTVAAYGIANGTLYNSDLVSEAELPDSFDGFADPKWAGQLAIDDRDDYWYLALYRYYTDELGWTDDEFVEMFKAVAANARVQRGHVAATELLRAGDFAITPGNLTVYVAKDRSGNVQYLPGEEPIVVRLIGANPMTEAKNPAAALLFTDFYLTEGQTLFNDLNYIPTNPSQIPNYTPWFPEGTTFTYSDWRTLIDSGGEWADAFANVFTGAGPALPPNR